MISLFERKRVMKSVIECEKPDDGNCTNVETVETVVHKRDEEEKDKALEVRMEDNKNVSKKATDDSIYLHETS